MERLFEKFDWDKSGRLDVCVPSVPRPVALPLWILFRDTSVVDKLKKHVADRVLSYLHSSSSLCQLPQSLSATISGYGT